MAIGEVKTLLFSDGVTVTAPSAATASKAITDTSGWTGSVSAITYDVSSLFTDCRLATWSFKDSNYKNLVGPAIDCTDATHVRVQTGINLPAGTYYLVGV